MQLTGTSALFSFAPTVAGPRPVDVAASERRVERRSEAAAQRAELAGVLAQTGDLRKRLRTVEALMDGASLRPSRSAAAYSRADIGLDAARSATVLRSTGEVNATPTSFTPFGPAWSGSSTALATIGGVYDGAQGDDVLTFDVRRGGEHGVDNLRIRVRDSSRARLDLIRISKSDPLDQEYTLSNGLVLTLGAGQLIRNEAFTVAVSSTVGSVVDPDRPLDGTRNASPNLEDGLSVSDGSFDVNGVRIAVGASDSINDVLGRITSSEAGVTATFDGATETVVLTQKTPGAGHDIVLGPDTSGFLAAVKLDGAAPTPGTDGNADDVLSSLPVFSTVRSGSLLVNGTEIAFDVGTDSLNDVLGRINAADAGVSASLVRDQRVVLKAVDRTSAITLDDGGTGLLGALGIAEGSHRAEPGQPGVSRDHAKEIVQAVSAAVTVFNRLVEIPAAGSARAEALSGTRARMEEIVTRSLGLARSSGASDPGLRFDFSSGSQVAVLDEDEQQALEQGLTRHFADLRAIFNGSSEGSNDGLVREIFRVLDAIDLSLRARLAGVGVLLDTFA